MKTYPSDELRRLYLVEQQTLMDIAVLSGLHRETVRKRLLESGVTLRTRSECALVSPKTGQHMKGKPRYFSAEWCRNISLAKRRAA